MIRLALLLLIRPRAGIREALERPPSPGSLLLFLGVVGLLRGLLEAVWLYAMANRPGLLLQLSQDPTRYLMEGLLFVAANVMTAYLRWAMYAALFLGIARWFGQRISFNNMKILAGLMLGLYLVPVLVNSLYLVLPLPSVKFTVAQVYQPIIGIGQMVTTVWFAWIAYTIFRQVCGLQAWEALMGAVFIPLLDRVLFVGAAAAIFQWRWLACQPVTQRMGLVTIGFLVVAAVAVPLFLRAGTRVTRGRSG